ncbi:sulfotransferase [Aestuariicella hydrocarbonica]|uniref:Sulfotransferase n=1 Tax=Pseudomaricurvus hydrocarbonicus TaxID=1470433 RepID=A0A9E5JRV8_9GAMM|nr:sulfotransferase [Aestuariicella hydrocarbonica]NHO65652.1 sulfotransferase [Aestuariicella hydrocarbonica]
MIKIEEVIAGAEQASGLKAKLDMATHEGLSVYLNSLNTEAPLTERGWASIKNTLISNLSNRLQIDHWLEANPELLQRPVEKPMFVFGLPRTGTTLAINLLNADSNRRCLLRWEALNPIPPAQADQLSSDPRCLKEQEKLNQSLKHIPHISAIHHEDADGPTECQFAMAQSFCAQLYDATSEVPSYRHWLLHEADYLPVFQHHKRLLQVLQANNSGQWTLKNPWHPLFLSDLTSVYPDAQLVMTHRDPVDVVGSACSLIKQVRLLLSDDVNLEYIGESMLDIFEEMIRRTLKHREMHGWDSIYDLQYSELMINPIGEMKKLYAHFHTPWTSTTETAMQQLLAKNPKGKFGKHEYTLDEFGLSKSIVRDRLSDYCNQFNVTCHD